MACGNPSIEVDAVTANRIRAFSYVRSGLATRAVEAAAFRLLTSLLCEGEAMAFHLPVASASCGLFLRRD